jgi:aminoglycoside phosphotransferase family enzyme/predicted kinase
LDSKDIQQLLRPGAFPHPAYNATLRETHISWVILCGEFAYKIKKPVEFGFLDFSTLARRQYFCEQELALNSRFAPELYQAVVAITRDDQGPAIEGDGPVIDYAVRMRRFDENQRLDNIAARGELDRPLVRALARELVRLQGEATPCYPTTGSDEPGSWATLQSASEQNFEQVRNYPLDNAELEQLTQVEHWFRQRFTEMLSTLERRLGQGWVIDGHGDAHLGNIALIDGVVRLFDCIEFSPSLRIMDSIGEIALLTMDLDARGHHGEAHHMLIDYLEYRGDYAGLALLDLYRSYFAMVRAKVALLRHPLDKDCVATVEARADKRDYEEFCRYLALAYSYCQSTPRFLAITHGVSGTGKSTIADKLVAAGGAVRIRSDVERKRLFGLVPEQRSQSRDQAKLYSTAMSRKTFAQLEQLANEVLDSGFAVIVDATFLHRRVRNTFRQLAKHKNVPFIIIDCIAAPDQLRQRLIERERQGSDASEAGVVVMEKQLSNDEALADEELACRMAAESTEDAGALWQRLLQFLVQE